MLPINLSTIPVFVLFLLRNIEISSAYPILFEAVKNDNVVSYVLLYNFQVVCLFVRLCVYLLRVIVQCNFRIESSYSIWQLYSSKQIEHIFLSCVLPFSVVLLHICLSNSNSTINSISAWTSTFPTETTPT